MTHDGHNRPRWHLQSSVNVATANGDTILHLVHLATLGCSCVALYYASALSAEYEECSP